MDEKEKIFKHLQDRLSSVSDREDKESREEIEKRIALARIFLQAKERYDQLKQQHEVAKKD